LKLLFFCPLWGSADLPIEVFAEKAKKAGYDGVEAPLPMEDPLRLRQMLGALEAQGLELIAQHYETANPDPEQHLAEYCRRLESLADVKPRFINSQTGKDWFSFDQNLKLIAGARAIAEKRGVKIIHETHRGKFSFNPGLLARYLEADPDLRVAADFSHWCVVSESLLEDQPGAVALAISRADHIHARVGFAEGPQVSDPRAPEWTTALNAHLAWWDRIVVTRQAEGAAALTIAPEFGPLPYLPALPYTGMPVASQWDINVHMMHLLRARYQAR
jgi:sugar phosphate isomerase/epimerase